MFLGEIMWTKDDYFKVLKKTGFEQLKGKKSDGSTRTFVHADYPLVRLAVVDHKNTKEITRDNHTDLFNGICLVVLLNSLHNNKIDMASVEAFCAGLDKSWQKAIKEKLVPPTINYKEKDEECDLNLVVNKAEKAEFNIAMSNSLGFGGHNSSIIMKKWNVEE